MAGNFWQSSHCQQWLLDRQDVLRERGNDLKNLSEEDYQKLMVFFANYIQAIGEGLKVRQQVIATATVYFKRFYARKSLKCIDPFLLAPTCVFLASKVEEFGMMSTTKLTGTLANLLKTRYPYAPQEPIRVNQILEAEFFLLEMMDCCLIVYHPYRPLTQFLHDLAHSKEIKDENLSSLAWKICNDSLRTDVSLLYPPYQIALACLHIASVMIGRDLKNWFAELSVDMEKVFEVMQYILSLYRLWKNFDEKEQVPLLLQKIGKPSLGPSLMDVNSCLL
uniref:Cyclin-like domain-containing protein n=1 Tax=Plectus sambesii TaxID=2011161 RepID=A0A914W1N9_9BILA